MATLSNHLALARCPHCRIAHPNLSATSGFATENSNGNFQRLWRFYTCKTCGGVVTAWGSYQDGPIIQMFPSDQSVDEDIPRKAASFLSQAIESMHAPAGAIMLCASSVDAMLKEKGYRSGNLYERIDKAVEDHLITKEMGTWAHQVRLDANNQRHADDDVELPEEEEAKRCVDFVLALGEFLFVLPSRVTRGLKEFE